MKRENTGKGKAPYIPFWVADYLGDSIVDEMNISERGIYTTLLFTAWDLANKNDEPPTLKADLNYLGIISRAGLQAITAFFDKYPALWQVTPDGKRIFQRREVKEFCNLLQSATKTQRKALAAVEKRHGADADTVEIEATIRRLQIAVGKCTPLVNQKVNQLNPQLLPQLLPVQSTEYRVQSIDNKDIKKDGSSVNRGVGEEENTTPPPPPKPDGERRYTFEDFLNDKCTLEDLTHEATQQPKGELLTLEGNPATSARPYSVKEFIDLWNRWIEINGLQVEKIRKLTPEPEMVKKFQARQKAFADEGANGREFWARLLSVAMEANNGFYIGNGKPNAGYSQPFKISFDWLFKSDNHIAKLLEAQREVEIEWTKAK